MDCAMAARAEHDEVRNLSHSTLLGLGQRDSMMGLDYLDAIDLERLDAARLAEQFTAVVFGEGGLGFTR